MRKIICDTTFLDGRDRFEKGETLCTESGQGCRVITDEQCDRFLAASWAHLEGDAPAELKSGDVKLDVHNVTHKQVST